MKCLMVSATEFETAPFREAVTKTRGSGNIEWDFLVTGVGGMATTYTLSRYFQKHRPLLAVQAGLAGVFEGRAGIGDVVAVSDETIADLGVQEINGWKDLFDLGFLEPEMPPFQHGKLVNPYLSEFSPKKISPASAITVNQITTDPDRVTVYVHKYQPVLESMEGAAFHYVCLNEKIPFLQLRAISNVIAERDKHKWKLKEAIDHLNEALLNLDASLPHMLTLKAAT